MMSHLVAFPTPRSLYWKALESKARLAVQAWPGSSVELLGWRLRKEATSAMGKAQCFYLLPLELEIMRFRRLL